MVINTVGDLKKALSKYDNEAPIMMEVKDTNNMYIFCEISEAVMAIYDYPRVAVILRNHSDVVELND